VHAQWSPQSIREHTWRVVGIAYGGDTHQCARAMAEQVQQHPELASAAVLVLDGLLDDGTDLHRQAATTEPRWHALREIAVAYQAIIPAVATPMDVSSTIDAHIADAPDICLRQLQRMAGQPPAALPETWWPVAAALWEHLATPARPQMAMLACWCAPLPQAFQQQYPQAAQHLIQRLAERACMYNHLARLVPGPYNYFATTQVPPVVIACNDGALADRLQDLACEGWDMQAAQTPICAAAVSYVMAQRQADEHRRQAATRRDRFIVFDETHTMSTDTAAAILTAAAWTGARSADLISLWRERIHGLELRAVALALRHGALIIADLDAEASAALVDRAAAHMDDHGAEVLAHVAPSSGVSSSMGAQT